MEDVKAALIQLDSRENEKDNFKSVEKAVKEAAGAGAKLLVLPETADYIGPDMAAHAKEVPGRVTEFFSDLARSCKVWIHAGSLTMKWGSKPKNTSLFFSDEGEMVGNYSKMHLFDVDVENGPVYRESDAITAGEGIGLVDTPFGKCGLSICYDIRFPELYRLLAKKGAEILIVAADFTDDTGAAHWESLLRARAIENTAYVLACDQCGEKAAFKAHGNSMIIDPWGRILARAGDKEEIIYADLKKDTLVKIRQQIPSLENQRKDIYEAFSALHF